MGKIIALVNFKGGVGKTSVATTLTAILSEKGYKTVLIDCDQQCNSTDTFRAKSEGAASIYDVLLDDNPISISEALQQTECGTVVAGDPLLRNADEKLNGEIGGFYRLADALDEFTDYDYIIIDTAPAMNSILHNCLTAADEVIIPMTADRYALQGLAQLNTAIMKIRKRENPKLRVAGLLLTKYNGRANLSKEVRAALEEFASAMNTKIFNTAIRECIKVREAQAQKRTLISYAPNCTAAEDYKRFTEEFIGGC